PFMIDSIKRDDAGVPTTYILRRFNKFALGAPYLESITISMFGNTSELFDAYNRGLIESIHDVDPASLETLSKESVPTKYQLPRLFGALFNQNKKPLLTENAVRAALSGVIEGEGLVNSSLFGYGTPLDGPLPPPCANSYTLDALT